MTLHRLIYSVAGAFSFGMWTMPNEASAQAVPKCRPADGRSAALITELKQWVLQTAPDRVFARDSIFHVPVVPVNQITLVTDERICGKVAEAYSRLQYNPYTPPRLYVIKMGTKHYVGFDPDRPGYVRKAVRIFNSKYIRVGGWT